MSWVKDVAFYVKGDGKTPRGCGRRNIIYGGGSGSWWGVDCGGWEQKQEAEVPGAGAEERGAGEGVGNCRVQGNTHADKGRWLHCAAPRVHV